MTPSDQKPPEARRRRLDDLFGDEPFLSSTMKARRLHEKMMEHAPLQGAVPAGSLGTQSDNRLSTLLPDFIEEERPPLRIMREDRPRVVERAAILREVEPSAAALPVTLSLSKVRDAQEAEAHNHAKAQTHGFQETEPMEATSLSSAAAYLRRAAQKGQPESERERLLRFRKDVLTQWLKDVPKREINRNREER